VFGSCCSPLVSVPLADSALTLILGPAGTTKQEGGRFLGVIGYSPLESQVGAAPSNIPEMALLSWLNRSSNLSPRQNSMGWFLNGVVFNELLSTLSCSGIIVTNQIDSLQDAIRAYDLSAIFKWWHPSPSLKPLAVVLIGTAFKSGLEISGTSNRPSGPLACAAPASRFPARQSMQRCRRVFAGP
jgi:hypothetical protein